MYIVKMDGMTVREFRDPIKANAWAIKHCRGKIEVIRLTETELPKASKMRHPMLENYGAYKYNPFVMD